MTLHLIKLSVGPDSLSDLAGWQQQRLAAQRKAGQKEELIHITRQMPRRAEELLAGGSIYWVIKGFLCARQRLTELRPMERDGIPHCGIVYAAEMIRVEPLARRPFQGWRYLQGKDAPKDVGVYREGDDVSDAMLRDLAELGLL